MAAQDLAAILSSLRSDGLADLPITETADRIEMLAASDLKKLKEDADTKKLIVWAREAYTKCDNARAAEKRQWRKDMDMFQGRQFTEWDKSRGVMIEPPAPDYEPRLAVNVIEPIVRTEMAKTGSKRPKATVVPASNEDSDVMAALAGQDVWDWFYDDERFQTRIFNPANFHRTVTGNGFIKIFRDITIEDKAATRAAVKQVADQMHAQDEQAEMQNVTDMFPSTLPSVEPVMGKLRAIAVSPFNILVPDLAEIDIQNQPYVLHVYTMPLDRAKIVYADYVDKKWAPTAQNTTTMNQDRATGQRGGNTARPDVVEVIEAWVKPNMIAALPKGGVIITVADELVGLAKEGIPFEHGEYPFAHLCGIETGRFYRKSIVTSVTPLQNEINRTYAQIIKQKNLNSKPQFFYDEGSVDPRKITSRAGQYIPIRLGMNRPSAVPIVPLPQYVLDLLNRLSSVMDDISGQHQISRAQAPGANTAASALSFLQETDDNFLFTTFDSIEAAIETVARQYLSNVVQYWDTPRMVTVAGSSHATDAQMLSGSDLITGTEIRIESGSALPQSKAAKIATVTDWIKNGIIQPDVGLEAMEMGTLGKIYDRMKSDRDAAKRENLDMRDLDPDAAQQFYDQLEQAQQQQMAEQQMAQQAQSQFSGLNDPALGLTPQQPIPGSADPAAPPIFGGAQQPAPALAPAPAPVAPAMPGQPAAPAVPNPNAQLPLQLEEQKPIFWEINWFDNDQVHMDEHKAFANSQAYRNLPDITKRVFEDHYWAHRLRAFNLSKSIDAMDATTATDQAALLAAKAPTVKQTARIGEKNKFAGQQYSQ